VKYFTEKSHRVHFELMKQEHLKLRGLRISENPAYRIIHISDIHYKGDKRSLFELIDLIHMQKPDLVCFTGDLAKGKKYEKDVLEILGNLKVPLYGVPGNWDYRNKLDFKAALSCFESTGGKWLVDGYCVTADNSLMIIGATGKDISWIPDDCSGKRILLVHYPKFVDKLADLKFDLILAGHSHGGQVRLPYIGAIMVPYGVGKYDLGLFKTKNGHLHVTSGIGTSAFPLRFRCPPEIVVIEF